METTVQQSQEEIIFANTDIAHKIGWNKNYPLGSMGNIQHWIDVYCGLNIAEQVILCEDAVRLFGDVFAIFEINNVLEMPIFNFVGTQAENYNKKQKIYIEGLKKNLKPALAPEYFGTYKFNDGDEPHIYSAKNPSDEQGDIICKMVASHPEYKLHADKILTSVNTNSKMMEALKLWVHSKEAWAQERMSDREKKAYDLTMEIINQSK